MVDEPIEARERRSVGVWAPLRFLFLNNKDPRNPKAGGGTLELFRLMIVLASRGHRVTLLTSRFKGAPDEEWIQGVRIIRTGGLYSVFILASLKALSLRRSFDVVVDVALFGIPFFSRLYLRKPVMSVCYHLPRETFKVELANYGFIGSLLAFVATVVEDRIYPFVYRNVPLLTFSETTRLELIAIGFPSHNVHVVDRALAHVMLTNSFETSTIDTRMKSFGGSAKRLGQPLFICLGRLKKYKGVQDAIRAMTELIPVFPDAKLAVVGVGDYEADLKRLSHELDLSKNVVFLGYVDFARKLRLLKEATALIMPSYKEGFPTPVLEAQACGTPVVASNATGVYEYVAQTKNSYVFPVGDWRSMASYLSQIIKTNGNTDSSNADTNERLQSFDWQAKEKELVRIVELCLS